MPSTTPVTQSTAKSSASASESSVVTAPTPATTAAATTPAALTKGSSSASEISVVTAPTPATTTAASTPAALTPVSPDKLPAPPSSLPVSPISIAGSGHGNATTRSDTISFGSILAPDTSAEKTSTAVSMTSVLVKSEVELEDGHEIHCDHLSVHSQTSGTASYITVDPMPDVVSHYLKKKRPKQVVQGSLTYYGDVSFAKHIVLHPHNAQPLRCKANPKLLKLLHARQKVIRKANSRGHRYFKITAVRMMPRHSRPPGERELGVGVIEAHTAALLEFIASPLSAHSRLLIRTRFDETNNVSSVDIDVIDERAGGREDEDEAEPRVPDSQVRADYYSTLDRPPVQSSESLANVLTECEASTMMKSHDASTAKPISARPAEGLFSRMVKRLTFGVFG